MALYTSEPESHPARFMALRPTLNESKSNTARKTIKINTCLLFICLVGLSVTIAEFKNSTKYADKPKQANSPFGLEHVKPFRTGCFALVVVVVFVQRFYFVLNMQPLINIFAMIFHRVGANAQNIRNFFVKMPFAE